MCTEFVVYVVVGDTVLNLGGATLILGETLQFFCVNITHVLCKLPTKVEGQQVNFRRQVGSPPPPRILRVVNSKKMF